MAEVENLQHARRPRNRAIDEEEVRWFDVPVHDPMAVGHIEPREKLHDELRGFAPGNRAAGLDFLFQRPPTQALHDEIPSAIRGHAKVRDVNEVRMIASSERSQRLRLHTEAFDDVRIVRELAAKELHTNGPLEKDVQRLYDHAHRTRP